MVSSGGMTNGLHFLAYHIWLGITSQSQVSVPLSLFDFNADVLPLSDYC